MVCYALGEVIAPIQSPSTRTNVVITTRDGNRFILTGNLEYLRPRLDLLDDVLGPGQIERIRIRQLPQESVVLHPKWHSWQVR